MLPIFLADCYLFLSERVLVVAFENHNSSLGIKRANIMTPVVVRIFDITFSTLGLIFALRMNYWAGSLSSL